LKKSGTNKEQKISIDVSGLKSGVYFVKVSSDSWVGVGKFVKE